MSTFTTLFSDTFHRANESPLNPTNWFEVNGSLPTNDVLEIVNDVCTTTTQVIADGTAVVIAPAQGSQVNCWCEAKIARMTSDGALILYLRTPSTADGAYAFLLSGPTGVTNGANYSVVQYSKDGGSTLYTFENFVPLTVQVGDVFRFAIQGTTNRLASLLVYQNGNHLVTISLVHTSSLNFVGSGHVGMQLASNTNSINDIGVTNFNSGTWTA